MLVSPVFKSAVLGRRASSRDGLLECREISALDAIRKSLAPFEVSLPASVLVSAQVASWVRGHHVSVDVRTVSEWDLAVATDVDPDLVTLHCTELEPSQIRRLSSQAVGRLVIARPADVEAIRPRAGGRAHHVLLRMADQFTVGSVDSDVAADMIVQQRYSCLVGLMCDIGPHSSDMVSVPAAVGDGMAQMEHIHRHFGVVLTRLHIGDGRASTGADHAGRFVADIQEALEDACAALRFPRPDVAVAVPALTTPYR